MAAKLWSLIDMVRVIEAWEAARSVKIKRGYPSRLKTVFVIVQERHGSTGASIKMWLLTISPARWGDKARAMKFATKGEARRAALSIKITGAWFVEPA